MNKQVLRGFLFVISIVWACSSLAIEQLGAKKNSASISTKPHIRVGLIVFPPFVQKYEGDKCFGKVINDLKTIFPPSNFKVSINCATPARVYRDFDLGKLDLTVNVKSTNGLSKAVYYSDKPYAHLNIVVYSQKQTTDMSISSIHKFEYNGKRQEMIEKGYIFEDQSSIRKALIHFLRGATSHLISYKQPFEHYLNEGIKNGAYKGLTIDFIETPMFTVASHFVVNKTSKHALTILEQVNKFENNLR